MKNADHYKILAARILNKFATQGLKACSEACRAGVSGDKREFERQDCIGDVYVICCKIVNETLSEVIDEAN